MTYAALVGPNMAETTILSESEYKTLKNALRLARLDDEEADAIADAVASSTELRCSQLGGVFRYFFHAFLGQVGQHRSDEIHSMLVEGGEEPIFIADVEGPDRFALLKAFLDILRSDGWLASFLSARIERYAQKSPTPLELMEGLTEDAVNFDLNINDAKRLIREWPEFFEPQGTEAQEAKAAHATSIDR
ncbi:MAG: hypothetical protein ACR2JB_19060 [Bryobacteraceae bacterium]